MSATEVMQQFRALPKPEQQQVAEQIWDEAEAGAFVETPAFLTELRERAEEAHRHPDDAIPMEQVRAELRQKYGWN